METVYPNITNPPNRVNYRCLVQTRFRLYFDFVFVPNLLSYRRLAREESLDPLYPHDVKNDYTMKVTQKEFLLKSGVDLNNPEQVKQVKKIYRKTYLKQYMKNYNRSHKRRNLWFTLEENALIQSEAKRQKRKPSEFAKECILAYLNQKFLVPNEDAVQEVEVQIRKIGNNINQMAHLANRNKYVGAEEIQTLKQILFHMEDQVEKTLRQPLTLETFITQAIDQDHTCIAKIEAILQKHKQGGL